MDIENLAKVNDVAILTLSQNMSNIPTMYLSTSVPAKGTSVYIAGYGADDGEIGKGTSTTGFGTADLLRYAKIISTYAKVIMYFDPTFFNTSARELYKFTGFKYDENGNHLYFINRHKISILFNSGEYGGK